MFTGDVLYGQFGKDSEYDDKDASRSDIMVHLFINSAVHSDKLGICSHFLKIFCGAFTAQFHKEVAAQTPQLSTDMDDVQDNSEDEEAYALVSL